jgi:hypothetical protein
VITVAPVVVRPDIDSKTASVTRQVEDVSQVQRRRTEMPSTAQNEATTRKPSRSRSSRRTLRTGSQARSPAAKTMPKLSTNDSHSPSP